jgi:hypothetical protein
MQRSSSWLAALASAVGRALGIVESGPILPVYAPPNDPNGGGTDRLPVDKWSTLAENGAAAASVWVSINRRHLQPY